MLKAGRIAIVGRPNVGKSTLMNAMVGEPIAIVSRHPQTTRDRIAGVLTEDKAQLVLLDTPGIHAAKTKLGHRMNHLARDASAESDVILFLTDVLEAPPGRELPNEEDRKILATLPTNVPIVLVLTKIDRIKEKAALMPALEAYAKGWNFAAIVPISALKKNGLDRVTKEARDRLPKGEKLFEGDEISDKPVRFFVAEFVREQILKKTYQEVPHGVAVQVERFDESTRVPEIDLVVHVDKESHKAIVIGKKGAVLKQIATDARHRVERLLGHQVHLKVWVRVTPGWYESEASMRDMGYEALDSEKRRAPKAKPVSAKSGAPKKVAKTK
jgi:GTP-binding protein Era